MATVEDQTYYLEKKDQAAIICFAALIHQSHIIKFMCSAL
jgi:hypothetical protein